MELFIPASAVTGCGIFADGRDTCSSKVKNSDFNLNGQLVKKSEKFRISEKMVIYELSWNFLDNPCV